MAWDDVPIPGELPLQARVWIAGTEITPGEIARLRKIEAAVRVFVERCYLSPDHPLRDALANPPTS